MLRNPLVALTLQALLAVQMLVVGSGAPCGADGAAGAGAAAAAQAVPHGHGDGHGLAHDAPPTTEQTGGDRPHPSGPRCPMGMACASIAIPDFAPLVPVTGTTPTGRAVPQATGLMPASIHAAPDTPPPRA
jgi:hypothetical protein